MTLMKREGEAWEAQVDCCGFLMFLNVCSVAYLVILFIGMSDVELDRVLVLSLVCLCVGVKVVRSVLSGYAVLG